MSLLTQQHHDDARAPAGRPRAAASRSRPRRRRSAKKSSVDLVRSALHISKRADKNAALALKPIDSKRIKDGAVAGVDLANGAVAGSKLADDAVTTSKIAAGAVTGDDLADNSRRLRRRSPTTR